MKVRTEIQADGAGVARLYALVPPGSPELDRTPRRESEDRIAATNLTGIVADRYSFAPILVGASFVPLIAVVAVFQLIRNTMATANGIVRTM